MERIISNLCKTHRLVMCTEPVGFLLNWSLLSCTLHLHITIPILMEMAVLHGCSTSGISSNRATLRHCSHRSRAILPKARELITKPMNVLKKYSAFWLYGCDAFFILLLQRDLQPPASRHSTAAYATIRTFVMKFHETGLLVARKAGNRVFYKVH